MIPALYQDLHTGWAFATGLNIGSKEIQLAQFERPTIRYAPTPHFSCFALSEECYRRVGLFDTGFKVAYFEDNDYHIRMNQEGIKVCCDMWAPFVHFGSRSIKEGGVQHEPYFTQNREYFRNKWGYSPDGG